MNEDRCTLHKESGRSVGENLVLNSIATQDFIVEASRGCPEVSGKQRLTK